MRLVHKSQYIIGRCILYYFENPYLTKCKIYVHAPYKPRIGRGKTLVAHRKLRYFSITPRLQRLFMSPKITEHIIWHHSYDTMDEVMMHHFDGAWKHFNRVYSQFSIEP